MELNVNVNLSLDKETRDLIGWLACRVFDKVGFNAESEVSQETPVKEEVLEQNEVIIEAPAEVKETVKEEPVKEEPVKEEPKANITEAEARSARARAIKRVSEEAGEEYSEAAEKAAKKIIKNGYLQSAAFEHERSEEGFAVTKGGEKVKTLAELTPNEKARFCYLCESMHWSDEEKTVLPFDGSDLPF